MKLNVAMSILKQHNEWRRGSDDIAMANAKELGKAIDLIVSFAEKLTGEPSGDMLKATGNGWHYNDVFKAMINQSIKEVENETK